MAEVVHAAGLVVLAFKLTRTNTCSGLSLKSQELTAIFLAVRLYCTWIIEHDIHLILDFATLIATIWVIYMMRYKLNSSYMKELDNMPRYYTIVPSFVLAIFIHPFIPKILFGRMFWGFCVYLESVSVLPQLRLMQNAKIVEPFTSHYVFALGIARFLGFAHWIIQFIETRGAFLFAPGMFWLPAHFIAELIQTFILADFCYYYVKSCMSGQALVMLPV
ncbi:putative ER lumen protein-retaining receptor C28H8.4 [Asparagus officinalis]|uniref:putative ER lumen protein-retaining receptor C28H8.4 n=1 Tax=Asparagus officinalis TaxID=4686 RepID=UPI00098DEA03|nr:putative ER lumen protein-retaining receptor C28H8.4 [Asparagus officinalis]